MKPSSGEASHVAAPARRLVGVGLYRTLWRWHFYAGLWCIPFIIVLALSGSLYLFKPQFEAWQDRAFEAVAFQGPRIGPAAEVRAAEDAVPGARFAEYELPHAPQAAGRVWLRDAHGEKIRVVVQPVTGEVLDIVDANSRPMQVIHDFHGELLLGDGGSLFVELAACWAIVMVLTGLYLWWPRSAQGLAGVLWIRFGAGSRLFWRDLHAVTAVWISLLVLFLLFTGLPWTGVWGEAFKEVRQVTGTAVARQDWAQSRSGERRDALEAAAAGEHAGHEGHDHAAMLAAEVASAAAVQGASPMPAVTLDQVVAKVTPLGWAAPVYVSPPGGNGPAWARRKKAGLPGWNVRSDSQNRPLRQSLVVDARTGEVRNHETFADKHVIDRVVGIGVAAHEGQLFGVFNQLLGVLTAAGLVLMSVSGFVMWRRRKPENRLGAPLPAMEAAPYGTGLTAIIVFCAVFLPVLGASLLLVGLLEWAVLKRIPRVRDWLGLASVPA